MSTSISEARRQARIICAEAYKCDIEPHDGPGRYGLLQSTRHNEWHMDTFDSVQAAQGAAQGIVGDEGDWYPMLIVDLDTGKEWEVIVSVSITLGPSRDGVAT